MPAKQLPEDYILVLQQISEDGGDDFEELADALRIDRSRLGHIVQSLYHKGLIVVDRTLINVNRGCHSVPKASVS
jgi:DNA-binding MarR family transcriptional regulator